MHLSIAIDATHYGVANPTGVERYVDELLPRLIPMLKRAGVFVYLLDSRKVSPAQKLEGATHVYLAYSRSWLTTVVKPWAEQNAITLFFTPSGISPVFSKGSGVRSSFTIHDLSVYDFPGAYSPGDWYRFFVRQVAAAKAASALFVPSEYVRAQVERRLRKVHRVVVTPLAFSGSVSTTALPGESQELIYVGRVEAKKNLVPLVRAVRTGKHFTLHVVGGLGHKGAAHLKLLKKLGGSSFKYHGFLDRAEKDALIQRAAACVVPSPYEGFGLPVLEAFAAGVPVVAAGKGAAAEVAGGAALLVTKPLEAPSWAHALAELQMLTAAERESFVRLGKDRLKDFSWDETAKKTAEKMLEILHT